MAAEIEFFTSRPHIFVVEGQEFFVHAALIAKQSKVLRVHVDGPFKEASEEKTTIEDTDPQTFARFCRWIYSGFYDAADPETSNSAFERTNYLQEDSAPREQEYANDALTHEEFEAESEEVWGFTRGKSSKKDKKGTRSFDVPTVASRPSPKLWTDFVSLRYPAPEPNLGIKAVRQNKSRYEDYSPVLLSHLLLYVFPERTDIRSLKQLALNQLFQTLVVFNLWKERVKDIVALLRYCYENTLSLDEKGEPVREMLIRYVMAKVEMFLDSEDFHLLLHENADLLTDFLQALKERVR